MVQPCGEDIGGEGAVTVGASSHGFCNNVSTNLEEVARRW